MRIQQLEIDRFGVWEDVTLPFNERGVTVFYGPNEAGKSTLMRFIRGVLYGYQRHDESTGGPRPRPVECSGTIRLVHQGQQFRLRRISKPGTRGQLEINGRITNDHDPLRRAIVHDASEDLFQNIFAIGLTELQQLATLDGEAVSKHIYGLSLGPEGEQIFRAQEAFDSQERRLTGPEGDAGEIRALLQQLEGIDRELNRIGMPTNRHAQLMQQVDLLEEDINRKKRRQSDLQQELRGHQLMMRIWEPWQREKSLKRQLDALPHDDLDHEILSRLDELELELADLDERRKGFLEEARRMQQESDAIKTRPELEEHMCAITHLAERSREMQALERGEVRTTPRQTPELNNQHVQSLLSKIDGRWDLPRLEEADVSPQRLHGLMKQADAYRDRMRNRARTVRKYKKMAALLKQRQQSWKSTHRDVDLQNIPETRKQLRQRLQELEELHLLRSREEHLRKTHALLAKDRGARTVGRDLPEFFWIILWFFVIGGLILFAAGMFAAYRGYTGVIGGDAAWIIGGCYFMLGFAALGTCWTMKQHFSAQEFQLNDLGAEREAVERELRLVAEKIQRTTRKDSLRPPLSQAVRLAGDVEQVNEDSLIKRIRQQLTDLDDIERDGKRIESLRRQMSKMRQTLQDKQRDVSRARRDWTEELRRFGLSESLKITQAFEQCQLIANAKRYLDDWKATHQTTERDRFQLEEFHKNIETLAEKIEGRGYLIRDPYQLVAEWHGELQLLGERRRERARLKQAVKEKRRDAGKLVDKVELLRQQRSNLFNRLGVADRGEIIAKLAAIDERKSLGQQIAEVRREIEKLALTEPHLAITEDALLSYEESTTRNSLEHLRQEGVDLEQGLLSDFERMGQLRQELREIEEDRSVTTLRFDREQVADAIREATEKWAATRLANRVVDELRGRIEQQRQPHTLKAASEYLQRLTCGKYNNIWTPLGERLILVDDDAEQSLRVQHLSSGTREQVFLALRLAMIRDFADEGMELPLILDDVTVNFDQGRTEAAVDTLLQVADSGQQIMLFTCHLHLANIFESRGIEPTWLPQQRVALLPG